MRWVQGQREIKKKDLKKWGRGGENAKESELQVGRRPAAGGVSSQNYSQMPHLQT
jgi:hypothetical protein